MQTLAAPPPHLTVSQIFTIHPQHASEPARRWWEGMTLDEQDELLDRVDPQNYGPGKTPPMAVGRWNREKRRIRRARERWIEEIRSLRRPCHCENCRKRRRPPFPKYYVANLISYECWLEAQAIDPEMEEFLAPIRCTRERMGSVFLHRPTRPPE